MDRRMRANIIIHTFAVAAATWSALTAAIPVIGPGLADTAGLTAITIAMTYSLAALFGKKLEEGAMWAFATVVLGTVFGFSLLKMATSLIPGVGSVANATITFGLHEAIGWGLYLIFEAGLDPTKMSRAELKAYIQKGKEMATEEKATYERMMSRVPPEVRTEIEKLQKKLADRNLTDAERQNIMEKIEKLFEAHAGQ
jgi:uncharacterized protein (DUF697 family)